MRTLIEAYEMEKLILPSFPSLNAGVLHFFGTRHGPQDVSPNLKIGHLSRGTSEYPFMASLHQIHGTHGIVLDQNPPQKGEVLDSGDALLTNQPKILLTVRTADCVPVLVFDGNHQAIAAIHAGWRGAVAGIIPATLALLQKHFGSSPNDLHIAIGPSIGPCCYEVDAPVIQKLKETLPAWQNVVEPFGLDTVKLNLKKLVADQSVAYGVSASSITQSHACTSCRSDLFYSYRREGRVNGTMVSGIMLATPSCYQQTKEQKDSRRTTGR